jgi:hypothetical protein
VRGASEVIGRLTSAMSPSGLRTATDQRRAAHHHALEDGLASDRGAHALCSLLGPAGLLEPRWKRSTRPPVSMSFCLPV